MKIVDIREETMPISSRNPQRVHRFQKMTLSLVAVVTDVVRDGKPVIGYGFNSNGRYGQGKLIRERFRPRVLEAEPRVLVDAKRKNLDPHKIWNTMLTNEKPGGHGERSVAIGTIDMAVWDAVAKIERKPLFQLLADRYGNGKPNRKIFVYAAGGYYYPGQGTRSSRARCAAISSAATRSSRRRSAARRSPRTCGASRPMLSVLKDRPEALRSMPTAASTSHTAIEYAKALSQYDLFWYEEPGDPLDFELQADARAITTRTRWPPAKTCSRCRTRAT